MTTKSHKDGGERSGDRRDGGEVTAREETTRDRSTNGGTAAGARSESGTESSGTAATAGANGAGHEVGDGSGLDGGAPAPEVSETARPPDPAGEGDTVATEHETADGDRAGANGETRLSARQIAQLRAVKRRDRKEERRSERAERRSNRPKLKKLRALLVVSGLGLLALVSWVFGVLMAVASDLPQLEARAQFDRAENSVVVDRNGETIATLTGNQRRILVESEDISPEIKEAVVAIEDERFYEHRGIDYIGLARALREDIFAGGAVQGGSTITQQFVKNALAAQDERTVLQKLKESALAYQIERQWSKDKILTNYLNNIYFGEGAYGIEAAAKTYFGENHPGCGEQGAEPCASVLRVEEAALLAGMISSPTAYNPKTDSTAAEERRNVVLAKMRELGVLDLTDEEFEELKNMSVPGQSQIQAPEEASEAPYFTDWMRQQIVDRYGAGEAFGGGLEIKSTLDLELQQAAQEVVDSRISGLGPTAAVVVIDNASGEVRAMVGGSDFEESPFNVATNGYRQPGSAFKPFTLVTALASGVSPETTYTSAPQEIGFTDKVRKKNGKVKEVQGVFEVDNYEDSYLGTASLVSATTYSDNSVYAQLGMDLGPDKIAETAKDLGVESRISRNPAMILGGLKRGVTPLEMAYAYSTIANGGKLTSGTMGSDGNGKGPVAIKEVRANGDKVSDDLGASGANETTEKQVIEEGVAEQTKDILRTVVAEGTGVRAQVGGDEVWGKTGTTDNNADAWFVGANDSVTIAVWVGYEDGATPMLTEFGGAPVDGGTIPALIFNGVLTAFNSINADEEAIDEGADVVEESAVAPAPVEESPAPAPVEEAPAPAPAEESPAPAPEPAPEPEQPPAPVTPPATGDGGGPIEDGGATPDE